MRLLILMLGLLLGGAACGGVDPAPPPPPSALGKADSPQPGDDCGAPGLPCCNVQRVDTHRGRIWIGDCDAISFCGEISGSCILIEEG